jgi:hypothetical protein
MAANSGTFRKGDDRAWRAPLKHGARSVVLLQADRRRVEQCLRRQLRDGKRDHWVDLAVPVRWRIERYCQYLEKQGGPVAGRGRTRACIEALQKDERLLMSLYDRIEGRMVADDANNPLAAILRENLGS